VLHSLAAFASRLSHAAGRLSQLAAWLWNHGSSGYPGAGGRPSPDDLPGLPLPGLPLPSAPTLPVGPTNLSPGGSGPSLTGTAAMLSSSPILTADMRRRLEPPPFWHPAVLVSLTERPG
jgi:hypothetical protein